LQCLNQRSHLWRIVWYVTLSHGRAVTGNCASPMLALVTIVTSDRKEKNSFRQSELLTRVQTILVMLMWVLCLISSCDDSHKPILYHIPNSMWSNSSISALSDFFPYAAAAMRSLISWYLGICLTSHIHFPWYYNGEYFSNHLSHLMKFTRWADTNPLTYTKISLCTKLEMGKGSVDRHRKLISFL